MKKKNKDNSPIIEEPVKVKKKSKFFGAFTKLRESLGLTQRQMSDITDIKQPMLARLESGENVPKISTAAKLLKPFGFSLAIVNDKTGKVIHKFDVKDF